MPSNDEADFTREGIRQLAARAAGRPLTDASLARAATAAGVAAGALDRVADESLFDTEPALFRRILRELAEPGPR